MRIATLCAAASLFGAVAFSQTPVVRLQNLAHTTESLDKTLPFYRDVLGLPVNGTRDPLAQQPQKLDEDMSKFTATKGMSFRAASFRIPNAAFGFELTEFTGGPRKPVRPNIQDIGAATLALQVRDIEKVLAKVKASGAPVVTIGGDPVNPTGNPNSKLREIVVRDPDGFFVELQQPDPLPASAASTPGDVLGASVQFSIEDSAKTVAFLHDAIGFNARPTGPMGTNSVVANLIGLPGSQWRITHGSIPGTSLDFGLIEYSGVPRAKVTAGAEDPGSPAFTMVVRDIHAAVEQWTKAGGTVASTGGKPIVRANGAGNVFVRDVNGMMWELIQSAAPAAAQKLGSDAPDMGYKEVPDWPTQVLNAAGTPGGPWNFIQVASVAVDAQGHVLVLHRGAHPIMEFDSNGKYVRSWGDGMFSEGKIGAIAPADRIPGHAFYSAIYGPAGCDSCGAHSIRVDPEHNIWAVDAPGHMIYKMNPQGKVLLQLGHKGVAGAGHDTFNLPTDVGFAPNGDFYISDGYAGNRVVKFSHDGHYLLEWGTRGTGPGQFELPHAVVVDAEGKVYVSDRETHRIEVFDPNGKFLNEWPVFEAVSALFMTKDQHIWAGAVLLNLKGEVLGRLPNGTAAGGHGVAATDSGDVYLAQLSGKVQKFVRQ